MTIHNCESCSEDSRIEEDFGFVAKGLQVELIRKGIEVFGNQSAIARACGVSRQLISRYYCADAEMKHSFYLYLQSVIESEIKDNV